MGKYNKLKRSAAPYFEDTASFIKHEIPENKDLLKIAAGVAAGIAIGFIAGLLVAPKSGRYTRYKIGSSVKGLGSGISEKAKHAAHQVADLKDDLVDKVKSISGKERNAPL